MKASLFNYELPPGLVAQTPSRPRDKCRLMAVNRKAGKILDYTFDELPGILKKGDVLVFNNSKVIPARITFRHLGKMMEIFILRPLNKGEWLAIGKPGKKLGKGARFEIDGGVKAEIINVRKDGLRVVRFFPQGKRFEIMLKKIGSTPLPPYISGGLSSPGDYQTVYASKSGSVAAPTAGLHFTRKLLKILSGMGVELQFVTLHVGLGTFRPLKTEDVRRHKMHGEYFEMPAGVCRALNRAKNRGRRIIAVGTTAVRVLECSYVPGEGFKPGLGETSLYIYPGYKWKCVDALLTNFHLPKSTLLLLTCSFGGRKLVMEAYKQAIRKKYRFYSFGDAMLIE